MEVDRVSVAEYAKMRGVSTNAVYHAIKVGKIAEAVGDRKRIDPVLADKLWAERTNPDQGWHGQAKNRSKVTHGTAAADDLDDITALAVQIGVDPNNVPTLVESKTIEAAYKAQLARIEFEEKSGALIDAGKVKQQAFKLARLTRDAMLAIPDRVSAEIAGFTDPFQIHQRLAAEIRGAMDEISKVLEEGNGE